MEDSSLHLYQMKQDQLTVCGDFGANVSAVLVLGIIKADVAYLADIC